MRKPASDPALIKLQERFADMSRKAFAIRDVRETKRAETARFLGGGKW